MISYLLLSLAALTPMALRWYGGVWRGSPPNEGETDVYVWGACALMLVWTGYTAFVSWPVTLVWMAVTAAGYVYGERALAALGVPRPRPVDARERAREAARAMGEAGSPAREAVLRDERRKLDRLCAVLIAGGLTMALVTLPRALGPELEGGRWNWRQMVFPISVGTMVCGVGMKQWRRHAWPAAAVVCAAGVVVWFPEDFFEWRGERSGGVRIARSAGDMWYHVDLRREQREGREGSWAIFMGYGLLLWQLMRIREHYHAEMEVRGGGDPKHDET